MRRKGETPKPRSTNARGPGVSETGATFFTGTVRSMSSDYIETIRELRLLQQAVITAWRNGAKLPPGYGVSTGPDGDQLIRYGEESYRHE